MIPNMDRSYTYKLQNAIYTIIKFSLGLKQISHLQPEQIQMAIEIVDSVLEIIGPTEEKHLGDGY